MKQKGAKNWSLIMQHKGFPGEAQVAILFHGQLAARRAKSSLNFDMSGVKTANSNGRLLNTLRRRLPAGKATSLVDL